MKKRTIVIVSISLVLALIAIAVIATFPTYLLEEGTNFITSNPFIQSGNITETTPNNQDGSNVGDVDGDTEGEDGNTIDSADGETSNGVDGGTVGGVGGGVEAVLPGIDIGDGNDSAESQLDNLKELVKKGGAKLLAENGAFSKDAKASISKLGIFNKKYYLARNYTKNFAEDFTAYNVTVEKDGKVMLPIGTAKLVIDIPKSYNINNVEVYYLLSNGVQKLNCKIDSNNKIATIDFIESGVYILVETKKSEGTDSSSSNTSTGDNGDNSSVSSNTGSNSSSTTSSGSSSKEDPNKDTMDGWTPWY